MLLGILVADLMRGTRIVGNCRDILREVAGGHEALVSLQEQKLRTLLRKAKLGNAFYGPLLREISDKEIEQNPRGVLARMPLQDKSTIRGALSDILNLREGTAERRYTGGSTGEPFLYYMDAQAISRARAFNYYFWMQHGFSLGETYLVVGGTSLGSRGTRWKAKLYDRLVGRRHVSTDLVDQDEMRRSLEVLASGRYRFVYGYPSFLEKYADLAASENTRLAKVARVVTTSEVLTSAVRDKLNRVFGCPIIDAYGAGDGGIVACECDKQAGFHYNVQDCLLEELPDPETGQSEIVATSLTALAFPFIRYRVGDVGHLSDAPCACGSPLPRVVDLQGRARDLIRTPSGRVIHGSFFNQLFRHIAHVQRFQLVQMEDYRIRLIAAVTPNSPESVGEELSHVLHRAVSDESIGIEVSVRGDFVTEPGQKFRTVISHAK